MSQIALEGNLTQDPEVKYSTDGKAWLGTRIAVDLSKRNKETGEWERVAHFFNVTLFGTLAENFSESLTKGQRVLVFGRLEDDTWTDDEGNERSGQRIVADSAGPSLRWQQATVVKAETSGGGGAPKPDSTEPFFD